MFGGNIKIAHSHTPKGKKQQCGARGHSLTPRPRHASHSNQPPTTPLHSAKPNPDPLLSADQWLRFHDHAVSNRHEGRGSHSSLSALAPAIAAPLEVALSAAIGDNNKDALTVQCFNTNNTRMHRPPSILCVRSRCTAPLVCRESCCTRHHIAGKVGRLRRCAQKLMHDHNTIPSRSP